MDKINRIFISCFKVVMALLGIMAPVSMTGMCVFAQSPRDADDLVNIVIPPRFELGILYAPLNLDVLVPSGKASELSPEAMFPEATFIEEHAFRELKQGLEEISIPCRTVSFQRNGEFAWWIWRNYYAGEYVDHAYLHKQGFETNLIGCWTGAVFSDGSTNHFSVSESGWFQLKTHLYTVDGRVGGFMEEGRIWATPESILIQGNLGVRLYKLDYRTNSISMRRLVTDSAIVFRYEFTKEQGSHETSDRSRAVGDKLVLPDP